MGHWETLGEHAIANGSVEELGEVIESVPSLKEPLLCAAIEGGNAACVEFLIQSGADVKKDLGNGFALMAAEHGHADCLKLLLDAGASPEYTQTNNGKPIDVAVKGGHVECVKLLIDAGANIEGMNYPLNSAARSNPTLVTMLLEAGADPNKGSTHANSTWYPLYSAANAGRTDCIKLLLEAGAQPNGNREKANCKTTPLHWAAMEGHADAITMLIKAGADPNAQDDDYGNHTRPIEMAARRNHSAAIHALLAGGADPRLTPKAIDITTDEACKKALAEWKSHFVARPQLEPRSHAAKVMAFDTKGAAKQIRESELEKLPISALQSILRVIAPHQKEKGDKPRE